MEVRIGLSSAQDAASPTAVSHIAAMVNQAYEWGEGVIWGPGRNRTSENEVRELMEQQRLLIATEAASGRILGSAKITDHPEDNATEFGMLAVQADLRKHGVGRKLVQAVEARARDKGFARIQLYLLYPRDFADPVKEMLKKFYGSEGYVFRDSRDVAHIPDHARMRFPCNFEVWEKLL